MTPDRVDARAHALELALAELRVAARVEARDSLAIIVLSDDSPPLDAILRRACVREAQRAGFTHAALEIAPLRETAGESSRREHEERAASASGSRADDADAP